MAKVRIEDQPDLFAPEPCGLEAAATAEKVPADFIERIREELRATLARARVAEALPWPDLTRTYLAELRFDSISGWLPADEARALTEAFGAEMERLYRAAGEERPARPRF